MPGFEGISVTNFMNAWRERSDGEFPPELRALLEDTETPRPGGKGTRELAKQKLTVRLTGVQVVNNRAGLLWMDRKAKVYVLCLSLDTSKKKGEAVSQDAEGGGAGRVPLFADDERDASRYLNVSTTPLFHNVKDGDHLHWNTGKHRFDTRHYRATMVADIGE